MEKQIIQLKSSVPLAILISGIIISGALIYNSKNSTSRSQIDNSEVGVVLPIVWGNIGIKLTGIGVINKEKFISLYKQRGQFTDEYDVLLSGNSENKLKITRENAPYLLNLFWALGLANRNPILDTGEMMDPRYGGAGKFASTGGWTMAMGNAMDYYSRYNIIKLTDEQQFLVEKVSKGIYRPCCNNSTHFPDCNHGMAMLGLLELMASQGVSEKDMYKTALTVNSYWFPDMYVTIMAYMKDKGVDWGNIDPKEILGATYSSNYGYSKIESQVVTPKDLQGGGGCSV